MCLGSHSWVDRALPCPAAAAGGDEIAAELPAFAAAKRPDRHPVITLLVRDPYAGAAAVLKDKISTK